MKKIIGNIASYLEKFRVEEILFLIFIFCVPFSRHLEVLSRYSRVDGKFLIYSTFALYGFEIFLFASLLIWFYRSFFKKAHTVQCDSKILLMFSLFLLNSFVLAFFAVSPSLSFYYLLVLLLLFFSLLFITNHFKGKEKVFVLKNVILFSALFQGVIAITQFFVGGSLGMGVLGEPILNSDISGVAKVMIDGERHIRAYGTFPHPNVLAFFLSFASLINLDLIKSRIAGRRYSTFLLASFLILAFALLLTFSRLAIVISVVFWIFFLLRSKSKEAKKILKRKRGVLLPLALLLVALVVLVGGKALLWRFNPLISSTWESLEIRSILFSQSLLMFKNNLMGVGLGNHIIVLVHYLIGYPIWMAEPVHNTYLLILTETGLIGLALFLGVLFIVYLRSKGASLGTKLAFIALLIYMLFDHCFWDIRSAQYILFLVLSLSLIDSASETKKS